jgi:signal peptidase II
MNHRTGKFTLIGLILFGSVGCDQATKLVARRQLADQGTLSYLGDTVRLTLVENHGAFLGLGSTLPGYVRTLLFTGLVGVFLAAFLYWLIRTSTISRLALLSSSLLVGGGIGNLIDRIAFGGGVTDFLNLGIGWLRTGIFNVADVWIMVGAALMFVTPEIREAWREDEKRQTESS